MEEVFEPVVNVADVEEETTGEGAPWAGTWKVLTPHMRDAGGSLGMVFNRLPPGSVGCPFHWHLLEDEIFFILEGEGRLRYGERVIPLEPGDCISCPAGTKVAHQIANASPDSDLLYLGIGPYERDEVCGYPDSGKVMVRALGAVGYLEKRDYMDGEPSPPVILSMEEE